ncbi:MAG: hypothetical protein A07HR60_00639 [uncultured archaeon A07HR60]|nr:MAG: hypothetical protein J07HR59_01258 [Halorubrum sp. J07HR59]ESS12537.1 MAG: hypothetical protein A07HR60_00639 [uncultured archaeon A07HR60]
MALDGGTLRIVDLLIRLTAKICAHTLSNDLVTIGTIDL